MQSMLINRINLFAYHKALKMLLKGFLQYYIQVNIQEAFMKAGLHVKD